MPLSPKLPTASSRFRRLVALLGCAVLGAGGGLVTGPAAEAASPTATYVADVTKHTNQHRTNGDLRALSSSACLRGYAEQHARAMANAKRMYHQDMGKVLRGCKLSRVAENVAYGYPHGTATVNAWMKSKGHRANILASHRHQANYAVKGSDGRWYVAQLFSNPR